MRVRLWSILMVLLLVALGCPGRAANALAALGSDTSAIQLVGSLGGSATCVQVVGTYAYLGGPASLRVVDVSDPAHPAVVGSLATTVEALFVAGNLAYLAGPGGLQIVDVAVPAHPALRGSYDLPPVGETFGQRASRVQVVGAYAYVIFQETISGLPPYRSELAILDVRDRSHPVLVSRYDLGPSFNELAVRDGYAYIGGTTDVGGATGRFFDPYLLILDVDSPASPTPIGRYQYDAPVPPKGSGGFALVDDLIFLGMGSGPALATLDVHDRAHPAPLGSLTINVNTLRVVGQFAYVAETGVGLVIVDIRDSAAPVRRASYSPLGIPSGIDVTGDLVLMADDTGLRLVRFLPRTTAFIPAGGGTIEATAGRVGYQIPFGAFSGTVAVSHTLRIDDHVPPAPAYIRIGPPFEVSASYSATGQLAQPALPITITVGYTVAEQGAAVADTPALYHWDGSVWVKAPSSALDQTARAVTVTSKQLGMWALLGVARRAMVPVLRR